MGNISGHASSLREVIGHHMNTLAEMDDRVVIVNADLAGASRVRDFVERYPSRSYNVGIAEQSMVSFAAGLAHEGFVPFAFSMAPFITMRACEQCRTDVAYAGLPVRLMGTYAGVSGGISGATHWGVEDVAIMGSMAGMAVLEPCDATQAKRMIEASLDYTGPMYIRTTVELCLDIYDKDYRFDMGKASIVTQGDDGAFICTGVTVQHALAAAKSLKQSHGINVRVIDIHTIKPIDRNAVCEAARTGKVVVAQDHNVVGGLGHFVAATMLEEGVTPKKFKMLGVPDEFVSMAHAPFLYHKFGYDAEGLENAMLSLFD